MTVIPAGHRHPDPHMPYLIDEAMSAECAEREGKEEANIHFRYFRSRNVHALLFFIEDLQEW